MTQTERYELFLGMVSPEPNTGCWIWCGATSGWDGYGVFWDGRRNVRAHRWGWSVVHGSIPKGMNILHRCDNPACVNSAHLFLGTQRENVGDMFAKGRGNRPKGERHHQAKLSANQVREIYSESLRPGACHAWIADHYGVSRSTVWKISTGRLWVSVTGATGGAK